LSSETPVSATRCYMLCRPRCRICASYLSRWNARLFFSEAYRFACERSATADTFVFDIRAFDAAGSVVESWEGATFRAVGEIEIDPVVAKVPELAGPYLERVARASLLQDSIEVALVRGNHNDAEVRRERALQALDIDGLVLARADGKPLLAGGAHAGLSFAHCRDLTLVVKAERDIGCDLARVEKQSRHADAPFLFRTAQPLIEELLATRAQEAGAQEPTAQETARGANVEEWGTAAARAWAVQEVALKQNRHRNWPCKIHRSRRAGVVTFETAASRTVTIHLPSLSGGMMVAVGISQPGEPATAVPPRRELVAAHREATI
jgi:hypothetical protein